MKLFLERDQVFQKFIADNHQVFWGLSNQSLRTKNSEFVHVEKLKKEKNHKEKRKLDNQDISNDLITPKKATKFKLNSRNSNSNQSKVGPKTCLFMSINSLLNSNNNSYVEEEEEEEIEVDEDEEEEEETFKPLSANANFLRFDVLPLV